MRGFFLEEVVGLGKGGVEVGLGRERVVIVGVSCVGR